MFQYLPFCVMHHNYYNCNKNWNQHYSSCIYCCMCVQLGVWGSGWYQISWQKEYSGSNKYWEWINGHFHRMTFIYCICLLYHHGLWQRWGTCSLLKHQVWPSITHLSLIWLETASSPVSWGCRIHWLHLCRGGKTPTSAQFLWIHIYIN